MGLGGGTLSPDLYLTSDLPVTSNETDINLSDARPVTTKYVDKFYFPLYNNSAEFHPKGNYVIESQLSNYLPVSSKAQYGTSNPLSNTLWVTPSYVNEASNDVLNRTSLDPILVAKNLNSYTEVIGDTLPLHLQSRPNLHTGIVNAINSSSNATLFNTLIADPRFRTTSTAKINQNPAFFSNVASKIANSPTLRSPIVSTITNDTPFRNSVISNVASRPEFENNLINELLSPRSDKEARKTKFMTSVASNVASNDTFARSLASTLLRDYPNTISSGITDEVLENSLRDKKTMWCADGVCRVPNNQIIMNSMTVPNQANQVNIDKLEVYANKSIELGQNIKHQLSDKHPTAGRIYFQPIYNSTTGILHITGSGTTARNLNIVMQNLTTGSLIVGPPETSENDVKVMIGTVDVEATYKSLQTRLENLTRRIGRIDDISKWIVPPILSDAILNNPTIPGWIKSLGMRKNRNKTIDRNMCI